MLFNKKFKNGIKSITLVLSTIIFPFVSISCNPEYPRNYTVGQEWKAAWKASVLSIKFDSLQYEKIENYLEIKTTFIFTPTKSEFYLNKDYIYVRVMGEYAKIFPNEEKSKEISKFDVFSTVYNKTTCTYVFDVPISLFDEIKYHSTEPIRFDMNLFYGPDFPYFYVDYFKL